MHENLAAERFEAMLRTSRLGKSGTHANEIWDVVDSTNTRALELAVGGAPEGVVVAARQQTAGRGRLGRVWVSPPDSGLYISFLLRPSVPLIKIPVMSLATGAAVAEAIERVCGFRVGLKWVNDVVYEGRKLGGILAEMHSSDRSPNGLPPALIVGIGINLRNSDDLPDELRTTAITLETITGAIVDANALAAEIALTLEAAYAELLKGEQTKLVDAWTSYSATIGKEIRASSGGDCYEGTAVRLALDGALILKQRDGKEIPLHAGEISIRNKDGSYA